MRLLLAAVLCLALAGCDLFASGRNHDPITISGAVVFAETGAPLPGISATILFISPGGVTTLATTRTDAAGGFSVSYDPPEQTGAETRGGYSSEINTDPTTAATR